MVYAILGLTMVVMFIVLVIAFSYADRDNSGEEYEWED